MPDILEKPIVLSLNRAWLPIGHRTVKQALVSLNGGTGEIAPALGIDIAYERRGDGSWDFDSPVYLNPLSWEEWIKLPVRDFDLFVTTPRFRVRVPTVVVSTQYASMPLCFPRVTRDAIFERDAGICQYTGERVGKREGNLDHVVPKSRGGANSFENLVWAKREINALKGDKLPHEAGLRLLRKPQPPPPVPIAATISEPRHPDWRHFITQFRAG